MGNKNCCVGGEGSGKVVESAMGEQSGDGRYTMRGKTKEVLNKLELVTVISAWML